nr:helix-turn-helix domain-containing protein [Gordonia sp. KTR9]
MDENVHEKAFGRSTMDSEGEPTLRDPVRRAYEVCPVEVSVAVLGGSWKMTIVKNLLEGPMRYGALGRAVGPVTPRVLTRQLRELESDGIVQRTAFPEVPPRVEYSLTEQGQALGPFVSALNEWGKNYATEVIEPKIARPGAVAS